MLVLLDRDGVINEDLPSGVTSTDQLKLIEGSAGAIAELNKRSVKVAVVTNQSVVGKGLITHAELDAIHTQLQTMLYDQAGATIDRIYTCPDAPDAATHNRKPAPGMLLQALADFSADPAKTPVVGDALRDLQAATAAGCPRYLVMTGKGEHTCAHAELEATAPYHLCANLAEAVQHWLRHHAALP